MTSRVTELFLLYLMAHRLAVLAVAALSIWLGFRLLDKAGTSWAAGGSASAEGGGLRLSLTGLLPGIWLALFGTTVVGIMLWKPPELTWQDAAADRTEVGRQNGGARLVMREGTANFGAGANLDFRLGQLKSNQTLAEAARPLADVARTLRDQGRHAEALSMARLAHLHGSPQDQQEHLRLLAELLEESGHRQDAAQARNELLRMQKDASGVSEAAGQ